MTPAAEASLARVRLLWRQLPKGHIPRTEACVALVAQIRVEADHFRTLAPEDECWVGRSCRGRFDR